LSREELFKKYGQIVNTSEYGSFLNCPWGKLYSHEVIRRFSLSFDESMKAGEDCVYNLAFFKVCTRIQLVDFCGYNYRVRSGSLSRTFDVEYINAQFLMIEHTVDFITDVIQDEYKEDLYRSYQYTLYGFIVHSILRSEVLLLTEKMPLFSKLRNEVDIGLAFKHLRRKRHLVVLVMVRLRLFLLALLFSRFSKSFAQSLRSFNLLPPS
jgi:hypothetical protein